MYQAEASGTWAERTTEDSDSGIRQLTLGTRRPESGLEKLFIPGSFRVGTARDPCPTGSRGSFPETSPLFRNGLYRSNHETAVTYRPFRKILAIPETPRQTLCGRFPYLGVAMHGDRRTDTGDERTDGQDAATGDPGCPGQRDGAVIDP